MNTPGSVLRTERERQNRSLKDISKVLKIQIEYLKAIEDDNYKTLPAEVFTKSYMRLYADALNIESDYIFALYNNQVKASLPAEEECPTKKNVCGFTLMIDSLKKIGSACNPAALKNITVNYNSLAITSPLRKHFSYKPVLIIMAFMLIIISLAIVTTRDDRKPITKSVSNININVTDTWESKIADMPAVEEDIVPGKMSLKVLATEITWISVSIDDSSPKEWPLRKGETLDLEADEKFVLKIGNAGGTKVFLNGENLGILGPPGKVIDVVIP
jgi:hypothetical protein